MITRIKLGAALLSAAFAGLSVGVYITVMLATPAGGVALPVASIPAREIWLESAETLYLATAFGSVASGLACIWLDYRQRGA